MVRSIIKNHDFQGFSNVATGLMKLGLLSDEPEPYLNPQGPEKTWVY